MDVAIISVLPSPIVVRTRDVVPLAITVAAQAEQSNVRIRIHNMQPRAAELIDSDEFGDAVHTAAKDLKVGNTSFSHEIGFRLDHATSVSGAAIGLTMDVRNEQGEAISPPYRMVAIIAA
jgi:hypothetical protein